MHNPTGCVSETDENAVLGALQRAQRFVEENAATAQASISPLPVNSFDDVVMSFAGHAFDQASSAHGERDPAHDVPALLARMRLRRLPERILSGDRHDELRRLDRPIELR